MIETILANALAVWLGAQILRGVEVDDFYRAIIVGVVIGIFNFLLGNVFHWPSLGLFSLAMCALVLMVADYFLESIKIKNFWWAVALALIVSIVNYIVHSIF